jgi:hypothetical protein
MAAQGARTGSRATRFAAEEMNPKHILETAFAFRASKVLLTAVELGVFKSLASGPQTAAALARRLGLHGRGAGDFFDALVALDFLDRDDNGLYTNTLESSAYLGSNSQEYIGDLIEYLNGRVYPTWNFLAQALREGAPQRGPAASGGFDTFYKDRDAFDFFLKGMSGGSRLAGRALARQFPWQSYNTVIDVGSAQGCVAVELAKAHRHLRGGGFDLQELRGPFESYVRSCGFDDRLKFFSGNFFADPLPTADVLILGRILHDWSVPQRQLLLKKAYTALFDNGALIVCEAFIDDARRKPGGLLSSLNMLLQTNDGSEFTTHECTAWMQEVGFGGTHVIPLTDTHAAVVGTKGPDQSSS